MGEEYADILNNRALGDKFLKFGMVLDIYVKFSNSFANKSNVSFGDLCRLYQIKNGRQNNHQKQKNRLNGLCSQ